MFAISRPPYVIPAVLIFCHVAQRLSTACCFGDAGRYVQPGDGPAAGGSSGVRRAALSPDFAGGAKACNGKPLHRDAERANAPAVGWASPPACCARIKSEKPGLLAGVLGGAASGRSGGRREGD